MSMHMPWFRLYVEMVDDEKMRLLAFDDRWHYVALLCCKGRGLLDAGDAHSMLERKLAVKLGLQLRELEAVANRLAEVGLIDADTFQPLGWDQRQMQSDSSRERVAAFRERKKRAGNVTVTAQDTDTDTDDTEKDIGKEQEPARKRARNPEAQIDLSDDSGVGLSIAAGVEAAADSTKRKSTASGSRLPDGWTLPQPWADWALSERSDMTELDVRREAACFADYWHGKAGADARKADWEATWRNWIRRANSPSAQRRQERFDPVAHVNRNRTRSGYEQQLGGNVIDITPERLA